MDLATNNKKKKGGKEEVISDLNIWWNGLRQQTESKTQRRKGKKLKKESGGVNGPSTAQTNNGCNAVKFKLFKILFL